MKTPLNIPTGPFPLIPMRNMVLFPNQSMPIVVGRSKSRLALEAAAKKDQWIVLVAQKQDIANEVEPKSEEFYHVGTLARVDHVEGGGSEDRPYHATVTGIARFHISQFENRGHWEAGGEILGDKREVESETLNSLVANMKQLAIEIFSMLPINTEQFKSVVQAVDDPVVLTHLISQHLEARLEKSKSCSRWCL